MKKQAEFGPVNTQVYNSLQRNITYILPSLKDQGSWATPRCLSKEKSFTEIVIYHVQCLKEVK